MSIQLLMQEFCEYSTYVRGYSKATITRYRQVILYFMKTTGISQIEEVSIENIRHLFYHGRTEKQWGSNTYICYHKSLMVFFRWCRQEGHITSNPIESIEVPKLERKIPTKLTKQEAMRILEMVDNFPYQHPFLRFQTYAIFATFIYTGIRKKELLNLKFTDVDIENLSLFIRQGKGSKDRIIPINYKLAKALQKYLEYRKKPIKALLSFLPHILMICTLPKVASNV